MPAAAVLCVFCAVALLGWRLLAADDPWRRRWQLIAAAVAVIFVVQAPRQYDRISAARALLDAQSTAESDLRHIADSAAYDDRCQPVSVPVFAVIPRLAAWLELRPSQIVFSTVRRQPRHGYYLDPVGHVPGYSAVDIPGFASARDHVPPRFHRVARNKSWVLYARCSVAGKHV